MAPEHDRLNGWKDIAAFLRRSVRTVQRWERDYGLPLRRQGPDGELIFAYPGELEAWVQAGGSHARAALDDEGFVPPEAEGTTDGNRVELGPHCLISDGRTFRLREGVTVIGRADDADVQVLVPSVSRHHACIRVRGLEATLKDLESRHGSWRGAMRVLGAVPLSSGDEIRLGSALLVYRCVRTTDSTA